MDATILARIPHGPVRNAHEVPTPVGASASPSLRQSGLASLADSPILIAMKGMLFRRQYTKFSSHERSVPFQ